MKNFYDVENLCSSYFFGAGECWHLWTPENHEIIFSCEEDFKAAMLIIGVCSALVPGIKIITFELMTNHLHVTLAGNEESVNQFFKLFKKLLKRYLVANNRTISLGSFTCSYRRLTSLQDVRNVIVYNNRNGYVVSPQHNPYSYPWGANRYFFNPAARQYYRECGKRITFKERREILHSHIADNVNVIASLDGYACPLSFCDIGLGEHLFRGASHYFYELSRNVESQKNIAKEIGERLYYTDEELFKIVTAISKEQYKASFPSLLTKDDKISLAKTMHFEYNATKKQICRMLRIDKTVIDSLFPDAS